MQILTQSQLEIPFSLIGRFPQVSITQLHGKMSYAAFYKSLPGQRRLFVQVLSVLEFLNNLWGLGTE
jgi:hypothetical protein